MNLQRQQDELKVEKKHIDKFVLIFCFGLAHSVEAIYASSMPNISAYMGISSNLVQALSMAGFIGFSLGILVFGRVSDLMGRRSTMISGFTIYLFCTFLTLFMSHLNGLIICRFFQSFGVSVGSVVAQAIMRDIFHGRALSRMYSIVTAGLAFIPSLAASFGGFIASNFGWGYNMLLMAFAGTSVLVVILFMLPETHLNREHVRAISYFKIMKRVVKDRKLLTHVAIIGSSNAILFGFFIEAPFIVMKKCGLDPYNYAVVMVVITVGLFAASLLNSFLVKIIEPETLVKMGGKISVISSVCMILVGFFDSYLSTHVFIVLLIFSRIIFVVSHALVIPSCLRFALENYAGVNGTAGSIFGFMYYMFVAMSNGYIAKFHSDTSILPSGILFLILSLIIFAMSGIVRKD